MWQIYRSPPPACSIYLPHLLFKFFFFFFNSGKAFRSVSLYLSYFLSFLSPSSSPLLSAVSCPSLPASSARVISLFTVSHLFPLTLHPSFSNYSLAACFSLSVPISEFLFFLSCAPALAGCSALSLTLSLPCSLSLAVCSSMKLKRFKPLFNHSLFGKVLRWQKMSILSAVRMYVGRQFVCAFTFLILHMRQIKGRKMHVWIVICVVKGSR